MDLSPYTQALRDDLMAAAAVGDDDTRRSAATLAAAIEPAARLAILSALSDFASEVTSNLKDTTVEVRLDGRDAKVAINHTAPDQSDSATPGAPMDAGEFGKAFADAGGDLSRTTLRMFNELKSQAERAANEQGLSLNSFISRAVAESIRSPGRAGRAHRGRGTNVSGFIQG